MSDSNIKNNIKAHDVVASKEDDPLTVWIVYCPKCHCSAFMSKTINQLYLWINENKIQALPFGKWRALAQTIRNAQIRQAFREINQFVREKNAKHFLSNTMLYKCHGSIYGLLTNFPKIQPIAFRVQPIIRCSIYALSILPLACFITFSRIFGRVNNSCDWVQSTLNTFILVNWFKKNCIRL